MELAEVRYLQWEYLRGCGKNRGRRRRIDYIHMYKHHNRPYNKKGARRIQFVARKKTFIHIETGGVA